MSEVIIADFATLVSHESALSTIMSQRSVCGTIMRVFLRCYESGVVMNFKAELLSPRRSAAIPEIAWLLPIVIFAGVFLALLPTDGIAAVVLGGTALLLILVKPEYGLYLLVFSVPFGSLKELQIGPISASATEFLIAATALAWAAKITVRHEGRFTFTSLSWPLAIFIAILLLSATTALSLVLSLKEVAKWLELLLVFLFVVNFVSQQRQTRVILFCLVLAAFLEALLGWYQFLSRTGPESFLLGERFLRAYGTFGQPNPYAGYLSFSLSLLGGMLIGAVRQGRGGKFPLSFKVSVCAFLVILAAILMSFSRGAWLGVFVALCVMGVIASRRFLSYLVALLSIVTLLLTLGAFQLLPAAALQRLSVVTENFTLFDAREVMLTPENWAIVERMANWQATWEMFLSKPILGVGIGNFSLFYPTYALPQWDVPTPHAHNFYLNLLAESGILGVAGYLAFLIGFFIFAGRALSRSVAKETNESIVSPKGIILGVIGAMVALSVHNFFDNLYVHSMTAQVGLALGLVAAVGRGGWTNNGAARQRG